MLTLRINAEWYKDSDLYSGLRNNTVDLEGVNSGNELISTLPVKPVRPLSDQSIAGTNSATDISLNGVSPSLPQGRVTSACLKTTEAENYRSVVSVKAPLKCGAGCVITAFRRLETCVPSSNLRVHNVSADGDCLFWSAYQLNAVNV